jgi:TctA family transporter
MNQSSSKKTLRYWLFYGFWVIVPAITIVISAGLYGAIILALPFILMFVFGVLTYTLQDIFWEEYEKVYGEKR